MKPLSVRLDENDIVSDESRWDPRVPFRLSSAHFAFTIESPSIGNR